MTRDNSASQRERGRIGCRLDHCVANNVEMVAKIGGFYNGKQ